MTKCGIDALAFLFYSVNVCVFACYCMLKYLCLFLWVCVYVRACVYVNIIFIYTQIQPIRFVLFSFMRSHRTWTLRRIILCKAVSYTSLVLVTTEPYYTVSDNVSQIGREKKGQKIWCKWDSNLESSGPADSVPYNWSILALVQDMFYAYLTR